MGIHIIFPIKWGAKELPRVSQPHTSNGYSTSIN